SLDLVPRWRAQEADDYDHDRGDARPDDPRSRAAVDVRRLAAWALAVLDEEHNERDLDGEERDARDDENQVVDPVDVADECRRARRQHPAQEVAHVRPSDR